MFSGIVQDLGEIKSVEKKTGHLRLHIGTCFDLDDIDIGASIACNGCCLTVVGKEQNTFLVDVSNESIDKTTVSKWNEGFKINLERSLKLGDEISGHIVSGHVDGVAQVKEINPDGDSYRFVIVVPDALSKFIAAKGSVALDGISLTVNEVNDNEFGVNIIPHTWEVTNMSSLKPGDQMNLEVDMLARYVERMMHE